MLSVSRKVAFVLFAAVALVATGCNSNAKKIVGKWKAVSMTTKDGKEQKADLLGMSPILEFTADGNIKVGLDASSLPPDVKKQMEGDKDAAAKLSEMKQVGKYKVSGDSIEFQDTEKSGESPFGKNNKGKLTFEGDNLTLTGDDGSVKLSRMK
jgi:hypothetical protein